MKVLITTDWYTPTVNGVVTSILNLRKELQTRGHEVRILTLSQTRKSFTENGVTYIGSIGAGKIYPGARVRFAAASRLIQDIIDWRPEVVHSQCEFSTFLVARRISEELDIPLIHTYHTVYEDYTHYFAPTHRMGKHMAAAFSRRVLDKADIVISPTKKVKDLLWGYGVLPEIRVIPTGVNIDRFEKETDSIKLKELRKSLGIPEGNKILLYLGRLAKEKNIEEILLYFSKMDRRNLTLLIAGGGPYRHALDEKVRSLGIEGDVVFAGMVDPAETSDYYHLGDIFVTASESETQGLTYIEALASGLPTLCKRDACLDGVVVNGNNGWQYENGSEFLSEMKIFLSDESVRRRLSRNAANAAKAHHSSAAFAKDVARAYVDAIRWHAEEEIIASKEGIKCQKA